MPPQSPPDFHQAAASDAGAVEPAQLAMVQQLFVQNLVPLRGVGRALIRDPHRVDDLVQKTFLTITAKSGTFREGSSFRAWAFTIAWFRVLESLRKNPLNDAFSEEVIHSLCAREPESPPNEERMEHLAGCIKKLAPKPGAPWDCGISRSTRPIKSRRSWGGASARGTSHNACTLTQKPHFKTRNFVGRTDELAIVSRALDANEIKAYYETGEP